ncbi:MAG: N-acetylmuramoyl-L-alanine amidase [Bacteroidales bacterium]|nr:N-acetylmuramoyl-L-alanine amidase [Bacteroidales bacterium]
MKTPFGISFFSKINVFLIALVVLQGKLAMSQSADVYSVRKVVIDAGHGGKDPGAVGLKTKEKDITLKLALMVGALVEKNFPDVAVVYTRNTDVFIPLDERSRIANDAHADLFISIHCNSNENKAPFGTETYVMGLSKSNANLDVAMRENAVITYEEDYSLKYEGYDPNASESFIIFSMLQNAYLDQSLSFASLIQTDFRERINRKDRGVKQERFLVLWKTAMPSVLVEVGYLSNKEEEKFLNSHQGQEYIASSIYRAFKEYKQNVDKMNGYAAGNQFHHSDPRVPDTLALQPTDSANDVGPNDANVVFKVQVLASSKEMHPGSAQLKALQNVEVIQLNGVYKYCVGSMQSYSDILAYCHEVKKTYPDAFVIALKNGAQIPVDVAIKELSN